MRTGGFVFAAIVFWAYADRSFAQSEQAVEAALQEKQVAPVHKDLLQPSTTPTGRDLIILQKHKPFSVECSSSVQWTDNAFYQPLKKSDFIYSSSLAAGFVTTIGQALDFSLETSASVTRYQRFFQLDYDTFGGAASLSHQWDGFRLGLDYRPLVVQTREFQKQLSSYHDIGVSAGYQSPLFAPNLGMFASIRGSRVFAHPNDYDVWRLAPHAGIYFQPARWAVVSGGLAVSLTAYDNYFSSFLGTDRTDSLWSPFINLTFLPADWIALTVALRYADNDSSVNFSDYGTFSVTPSVAITVRF